MVQRCELKVAAISKVAVFGLDCLEPSLCFERWIEDLPNLRALMQRGTWGRMTSSMPPVTVPAWSCMTASKDPGTLGIYGFRDRKDRSYDGWVICTSLRVKEPRLWDILTQQGKDSLIIGVPETYPITKPIRGCMITSFLTPTTKDPSIQYTHPPQLRREIEQLVGEYMVDVPMPRGGDKQVILDGIYTMTRRRFDVVRHLMCTRPWDLMFMVEMGTDRVHHGFWSFMDPQHRNHVPGNRFENAIHDYYVEVDRQIGETLAKIDLQTTAIWVVSDHGARVLHGGVLLNQWLMQQGDLVMKAPPTPKQKFDAKDVDWSKTKAFASPGYYGQIFINLKGREPQGVVEPGNYERYRDDLIRRLEAMPGPDGDPKGGGGWGPNAQVGNLCHTPQVGNLCHTPQVGNLCHTEGAGLREGGAGLRPASGPPALRAGAPLGNKCHKPDAIYKTCNNVAPDLIVILGDLGWRASGWLGSDSIYIYDDDAAAEDANHAQEGMYLFAHPTIQGRGRADGATLYDVAPTILRELGQPIPPDMQGRPLHE
ncbi:MAG: alkaline phosphatase family protein [Phycisphaerales bacterium]|nr:alkaline phosphatase family protein [Phycisphaerales bacterium]